MATLRDMLDKDALTAHCQAMLAGGRPCNHSKRMDIAALAEILGWDFDVVERRPELMRRLKCAECGSRDVMIHVTPLNTSGGGDWHAS